MGIRKTYKDFTDKEKAEMLDEMTNSLIEGYANIDNAKGFHSTAEFVGYKILTMLNDRDYITSENILGK